MQPGCAPCQVCRYDYGEAGYGEAGYGEGGILWNPWNACAAILVLFLLLTIPISH